MLCWARCDAGTVEDSSSHQKALRSSQLDARPESRVFHRGNPPAPLLGSQVEGPMPACCHRRTVFVGCLAKDRPSARYCEELLHGCVGYRPRPNGGYGTD